MKSCNSVTFPLTIYAFIDSIYEMTVGPSNEFQSLSDRASKSENDLAVLTVRSLVADMCNQHGSGHGGSAIGMAAIGVALWKYVMRYNPNDPTWFDRDRFVLSNGMSPFLPSTRA